MNGAIGRVLGQKRGIDMRMLKAALIVGMTMVSGIAVAQDAPPPPPPADIPPPPPARPGFYWAPGHYTWAGGTYVWAGPHWIPARPGFHWVPEHWRVGARGRWHLVPGHWAP
jgi:hypothetical protein